MKKNECQGQENKVRQGKEWKGRKEEKGKLRRHKVDKSSAVRNTK